MSTCASVCETAAPCPTQAPIADVQNYPDSRKIAIDKVGIKAIRHPVKVLDKTGGVQHTIATFGMYVYLPHHFKGTHMSRFIEILNGNILGPAGPWGWTIAVIIAGISGPVADADHHESGLDQRLAQPIHFSNIARAQSARPEHDARPGSGLLRTMHHCGKRYGAVNDLNDLFHGFPFLTVAEISLV